MTNDSEHYHYYLRRLGYRQAKLTLHLGNRLYDLPNTKAGHQQLLKLLADYPAVQKSSAKPPAAMSARWSPPFEQQQIEVSILNPARVRHFARAQGQRAKTDRIDVRPAIGLRPGLAARPSPKRTTPEQQLTELSAAGSRSRRC